MAEILTERAVGQPVLHSASLHVVAVFTCSCGHSPLVITGVSEVRPCPTCRARYMIATINHTPRPDGTFDTTVNIGRLSDLAVGRPSLAITRRQ